MKIALVIFITLALAGCALLSLHMGVIPVPWRALLTDWQAGREHYYVLMEYRLPRLLLALFVGAALAVAGVLIQGIVRNPLASPDILGVNHAASLASVGALLLMPSLPVMVLPLLAFAGGMAGLILLKMLAKTHQPMKLALTGVALSACWASLTDYLMLSRPQDVNNALLWLTGSLWGRDWSFVKIAIPLMILFLPLSLSFCRDLDLLALGDARATTLGVSVQRRFSFPVASYESHLFSSLNGEPCLFEHQMIPVIFRQFLGDYRIAARTGRRRKFQAQGRGIFFVHFDQL